ncbi:MAG TPA: hypothetical protein VKA68_17290 [bacterium]|nr:hypothetical protein [bacterium]
MFGRSRNNGGRGAGRGSRRANGSGGRNQRQQEQSQGLGPAGQCLCPRCGATIPHRRGTRCQEVSCPSCGSKMLREGGYHHQLLRQKRNQK